ncbi:aminopeptidase P family protein [Enterococcus dispar]|uniref:aminopeptidase P family protein n=1 Tax=Enterococcus dispar TaxID=44009 RepID=UPI00249261BF|nr:Xaa-Pro peptidase family protein [Enterococcus dispar]
MNLAKIEELKKWLNSHNIPLAYISNPDHIAYYSGYTSDPHERVLALFISATADPFLFTPALEVETAKNSSWKFDVLGYADNQNPWQLIVQALKERYDEPKKIAIEKNHLTVDRLEILRSLLLHTDFNFDLTPVIQQSQLRKTTEEITLLKEAGAWADEAFKIGFAAIQAGASEAEITAEIEYQLKQRGISQMSFDTIVLAGDNAANPHGAPGERKIVPNELVLFDLGVIWKGYCSDATRTVAYQKPTALQEKIYQIVLEAQLAAQNFVRPGVTAAQIDQVARNVIEKAGYGKYFNHRLGHGIGTTVHEFPSLVEGNDLVIEEGMCFSIEPGIYIPGEVGVRIEDCVHVTHNGCESFTQTPKELQIITRKAD